MREDIGFRTGMKPITTFPAPHPKDPEFVFDNAMFLALADPAARRTLEVLRRGRC